MGLFTRNPLVPIETHGKKVVLALGGSGVLGKALLATKPDEYFYINVSKSTLVEGVDVANYPYDLTQDLEGLFKKLSLLVPQVDVLINLAYTKTFSSIADFEPQRFADEVYLDISVPILASRLCGKYFWSKEIPERNAAAGRKVINISSLSGLGKTARPELATYSGVKSALNIMTEYLHDYLWQNFEVSAHVVAPGSLRNPETLRRTGSDVWGIVSVRGPGYTFTRI